MLLSSHGILGPWWRTDRERMAVTVASAAFWHLVVPPMSQPRRLRVYLQGLVEVVVSSLLNVNRWSASPSMDIGMWAVELAGCPVRLFAIVGSTW